MLAITRFTVGRAFRATLMTTFKTGNPEMHKTRKRH